MSSLIEGLMKTLVKNGNGGTEAPPPPPGPSRKEETSSVMTIMSEEDYEKIQSAFGAAVAQQQGHMKNSNQELMDEMKQLKQEHQPSIVELLREMRDDIRLMRQAMEPKKQYETKVEKPVIRYKGCGPVETEAVETKNGQ